MMMSLRTANYHATGSSANMAEAHSVCSHFMSASAMLTGDAIIVASIFIVLLTFALFVRVLAPAVAVLLAGAAIIISCDNLIVRRKMSEPRLS